jgi:hypothetical protein
MNPGEKTVGDEGMKRIKVSENGVQGAVFFFNVRVEERRKKMSMGRRIDKKDVPEKERK